MKATPATIIEPLEYRGANIEKGNKSNGERIQYIYYKMYDTRYFTKLNLWTSILEEFLNIKQNHIT